MFVCRDLRGKYNDLQVIGANDLLTQLATLYAICHHFMLEMTHSAPDFITNYR